ncbi:hypothetical protein V6N13_138990 [Hibiscus sabdariffa]
MDTVPSNANGERLIHDRNYAAADIHSIVLFIKAVVSNVPKIRAPQYHGYHLTVIKLKRSMEKYVMAMSGRSRGIRKLRLESTQKLGIEDELIELSKREMEDGAVLPHQQCNKLKETQQAKTKGSPN